MKQQMIFCTTIECAKYVCIYVTIFDEVDFRKNTLHQVMYLGKKVRYQSFAYGKRETDS